MSTLLTVRFIFKTKIMKFFVRNYQSLDISLQVRKMNSANNTRYSKSPDKLLHFIVNNVNLVIFCLTINV